MTVNGSPIQNYPLPKSNVAIFYSLEFEAQQARLFAGMSVMEYEALPGDPTWCDETQPMSKADVIVLYRMSNLISAVQTHAAAKRTGRGR